MPKQLPLFKDSKTYHIRPLKTQLLKWIGNKQRFAYEVVTYFPMDFNTYFEPFLGSGAVLATLAPEKAIGSDIFKPLMEIWQTLQSSPESLKKWYSDRWHVLINNDKKEGYERIKKSYNKNPNGADLLFISRSCYGGVVRFRQADGYISTPVGIHNPVSPESFSKRVDEWHERIKGTKFLNLDYSEAMDMAKPKDLVYCDPPYCYSQTILYGAQSFSLEKLFESIESCKSKGIYVALSIDGKKRSGNYICDVPIPSKLFRHEIFINVGRSMLKRFQMQNRSLEGEVVSDRLLLTY